MALAITSREVSGFTMGIAINGITAIEDIDYTYKGEIFTVLKNTPVKTISWQKEHKPNRAERRKGER